MLVGTSFPSRSVWVLEFHIYRWAPSGRVLHLLHPYWEFAIPIFLPTAREEELGRRKSPISVLPFVIFSGTYIKASKGEPGVA